MVTGFTVRLGEARGSRINANMGGFDDFIRGCDVKDPPLSNGQFMWSVNRGGVMSS